MNKLFLLRARLSIVRTILNKNLHEVCMKYLFILAFFSLAACSSEGDVKPDLSLKDASTDLIHDTEKQPDSTIIKDMETSDSSSEDMQKTDTSSEGCGETEIVKFTTPDNIELVADYHPPKAKNEGAVILLHMIPPGNDRSGYPLRVREAFSNMGYAVLNIDRRGAGDSKGTATDAYGIPGHLDVEGAINFITSTDRKCPSAKNALMLIGASNGTTAVLDYTVGRTDTTLPDPKLVAFLSPGGYTEKQNKIKDHKVKISAIPLLIIHPDSEGFATRYTDYSDKWKIVKIPKGSHGTGNFDDGEKEKIQLSELLEWAKKLKE